MSVLAFTHYDVYVMPRLAGNYYGIISNYVLIAVSLYLGMSLPGKFQLQSHLHKNLRLRVKRKKPADLGLDIDLLTGLVNKTVTKVVNQRQVTKTMPVTQIPIRDSQVIILLTSTVTGMGFKVSLGKAEVLIITQSKETMRVLLLRGGSGRVNIMVLTVVKIMTFTMVLVMTMLPHLSPTITTYLN